MSTTEPNWYPDPLGRHEYRYWDGEVWTDNVSSHGKQSVDPMAGQTNVPTTGSTPDKVQRQVGEKAGVQGQPAQGGGTLFSEPVLVVNQKTKLIELNNEYAVYDQHGTQIGAVRQVGQSTLKKAARLIGSVDQFMTHSLQLVDMAGAPQLAITRPRKIMKSRLEIKDGQGTEIGWIVQKNMIGKINFGLEVGGQQIGEIRGENWRAWNFAITDHTGVEVARITKTWEGLAKTLFTTADNYVVQMHRQLQNPLLSMVVAAAVSVDTALKQDARGFG